MPWINRDIVCLLQNTEHDVSLLLERINESLLQTNILSPAFRRRLQPYLGTKTSHFIHELNNFARSPYDMIGYDRAVHYLPQAPEEIVIEFSSSGSSDEGIASTDNERGSRSRNTRARNDGEFRVISRSDNASGSGPADSVGALLSFSVSTTSEGTEAPGVSVSINGRSGQSAAINLSTHNRVSGDIIDLDDLEAGYEAGGNESASTSTAAAATTANEEAATTSAAANRTAPTVTENIELSSGSSDECEFVLERKPPHLRTPELVSLNSESDSDVVFVDESKPLRKTAFASSGDEEQKQRHTESKNKRPTPQTSITTAVGETASHTAADREELYNVGASTSTGLRSSGGGRGIKEMYERTKRSTASRRKRNLRSNRSKEDTQAKTMHRGKRIYESSCTPSNTDSSTRSSDSDSDEDFSIKRQRAKSQRNSRKAKPKSSKRKATQQTRSSSNSRSRNNSSRNSRKRQSMITNKEKKEHSKRCKVEMNTDSEYSSDDGQNLIELQRRLQALKEQEDERIEATHDYLSERERAIEQYNSDGYNNASDQLPTGSSQFGKIQTQQGVAFTKQENFDSDTNENSVHSSYALDRLVEAAEECFGVARNVCVTSTNEDQTAALNIAMEEDNTFSSTVTQTTTATTVTTTAANNRSVSRASVTTNNTNDDNDNDNEDNDEHRNMHDNYNNSTESSSTSSSTSTSDPTASSHSLYSATSDSEEDEEEDEQQHQQQVEAISAHRANINENENENETDGNSLGLQQLLDGASLGDDWLVQQLGIDEESTANHENAAVNESSDTEDVSQQQVQVEEGVSVPDIDNDVSSIFLNQHDSNLVMPFNYDAEGSQSDAE
ncbi:unnamed protein product [Ceratitis capitata]|nr:unnamed protein product [Ceratitis capitata]